MQIPTHHNWPIMGIVITIFVLLNLWTFALYGLDKRKAKLRKRRVRERTLILFAIFGGGFGAFLGMYRFRHKTSKLRFKIWNALGLIIAAIVTIHIIEGLTLGNTIRYVEKEFRSPNWPTELDGYRIAFITDMHSISDESMRAVIDTLNTSEIDLLLLGGDFADYGRNSDFFESTIREISRSQTTDGIWGVEGNHDNYARLFDLKTRYGIHYLDNTGYEIHPGFFLAGVQDAWNRVSSIEDAISGANPGDFVLLLSHNPDNAVWQPTIGIDLILAGHTHGGQVTFFGYPFVFHFTRITEFGTRFARGWAESDDGVPVFTSVGIGPNYGWPRVFAQPEVVIFTMRNEEVN